MRRCVGGASALPRSGESVRRSTYYSEQLDIRGYFGRIVDGELPE